MNVNNCVSDPDDHSVHDASTITIDRNALAPVHNRKRTP